MEAARSGCPVCLRARAAGDRTAAELAGELLNDPDARARLAASWGLCRTHAIAFAAEVGAPLAVAILHQDLCRRAARQLNEGRAPRPKAACPSCLAAAQSERHDTPVARAAGLTIHPDHPRPAAPRELPRGDRIAGALPIGALAGALRADPASGPSHAAVYHALADRLAGVVRHHDYRFSDERFEDWSACWEALALFSGTDPAVRPGPGSVSMTDDAPH